MTTLFRHLRRLHRIVPPLDYVMKYTDQGPHPGNHWFWRDGRANHGHNSRGLAYLRWKVKPSAASGYAEHGDFTVARLLIEARAPIPTGVIHTNTCGLCQCINPDHWAARPAPVIWRMQVLGVGTWQLVRVSTGAPAEREIVVHAKYRDVIHVVAIAPRDQRGFAPPLALCGLSLNPEGVVVTSAEPTCGACR